MVNITYTEVKEVAKSLYSKNGKKEVIDGFVKYFNKHAARYGITSWLRVSHFVAQCAVESAHFNTLEEYASGAAYEGRLDLGNTQPGDGKRFKGRGVIQLTGRANYTQFAEITGVDVVSHPEKVAEDPELSVLAALEYWRTRKLNYLADVDDVVGITKKINGGTNGLSDRKKYLAIAKNVFQSKFPNTDIRAIQQKLSDLGYTEVGTIDGRMGPNTSAAIVAFKKDQMVTVNDDSITDEFLAALGTGQKRSIFSERQNATSQDLRKQGSKTISGADAQIIGGGVAATGAAIKGADDSGLLDGLKGAGDTATQVVDSISPFHVLIDFFSSYWWIGVLIVGIIIIWQGRKIIAARVNDHQTGNTSQVGRPLGVIGKEEKPWWM